MLKITIDLWVLVSAIIVPSLFMLIVCFYILKKGSKSLDDNDYSLNSKNNKKFKDEIAFQVVCQELDMLLANTVNNLEKQRLFLEEYLSKNSHTDLIPSKTSKDINDEIKPVIEENNYRPDHETNNHKNDTQQNENIEYSDSNANYARIADLYETGMTSKQIAAKIKSSQSEVDLYIKLHLKKDQITGTSIPSLRLAV